MYSYIRIHYNIYYINTVYQVPTTRTVAAVAKQATSREEKEDVHNF